MSEIPAYGATIPDDPLFADLSGFQRDLLVAIAEIEDHDEDSIGRAIKDRLETLYDEEVNHGRLYPNLDQLVAAGLVAKSARDRRSNLYRLTDEGRALIQGHVEWIAHTGVLYEGTTQVVATDD